MRSIIYICTVYSIFVWQLDVEYVISQKPDISNILEPPLSLIEQRYMNDQLQEFGGKTQPTNRIKEQKLKTN